MLLILPGSLTAATLTKDGQPASVIVLSAEPTEVDSLAAKELAEHLEKISGAKIETVNSSTDKVDVLVASSKAAGRLPILLGELMLGRFAEKIKKQNELDGAFLLQVLLVDAPWFPERLEPIVRAASEGRLVIAVLPAIDAATAISECVRVADSAEWFADNLKGVISRRLAKKLCGKCRREVEPLASTKASRELVERLEINKAFEAPGCENCNSGHRGQVALHEILCIRQPSRAEICSGKNQRIRSYSETQAELSLLNEGARLISEGDTSLSEFMSACRWGPHND
jgi:hypothetical protein